MTPRLNQLLSDSIHTGEPPLHEVEEELDRAEPQVGLFDWLLAAIDSFMVSFLRGK